MSNIEEELVKAMDTVFYQSGQMPDMVRLPGIGDVKIDSDEARNYFRELTSMPRVITRVMDDGVQTKDGAG